MELGTRQAIDPTTLHLYFMFLTQTKSERAACTLTPTPDRLDPELLPQDFDPEHGVGPPDGAALEEDLFGDLVGCGDIKLQLKRIRSTFIHAERLGRDPREARITCKSDDISFFIFSVTYIGA